MLRVGVALRNATRIVYSGLIEDHKWKQFLMLNLEYHHARWIRTKMFQRAFLTLHL